MEGRVESVRILGGFYFVHRCSISTVVIEVVLLGVGVGVATIDSLCIECFLVLLVMFETD
jgi:hypothetical protein